MGDVLNAEQAAKLLRVSAWTVRELARKNEMPARKVGKEWRFSERALLVWLAGAPERFADMTMLKPDEVEFVEQRCGLSFAKAKLAAGEGGPVPFWSFLINDRPPTEEDIQIAHELVSEVDGGEREGDDGDRED